MKVILSITASQNLKQILSYILIEFGRSSLEKFALKLKNKIKLISSYPESSPISQFQNDVYKCVVTKQIIFFYRIDN